MPLPFMQTESHISVFTRARYWSLSSARCESSQNPHILFLQDSLIINITSKPGS